MIDDIQEMGFNHDQARMALEMVNGNKVIFLEERQI